MPYHSSSPDPLSASTGPSIAEPPRRSRSPSKRSSESPIKRRFISPSKPRSSSTVNIHSPTKMTATSNSVLSPWRIKVMVQAERDSDEEGTPSGRGKPGRTPPNFTLGFDGADYDDGDDDNAGMDIVLPPPKPKAKRSRSRSVGVRTRTTTVKVKGLSSSPEKPAVDDEEPKTAPKDRRKSTTAKRPATPIASRRGSSSKSATTPKSTAGNTPKKVPASKPAATPRRKRTAKTPAKAKAKAPDATGRDSSKGPSIMSEEIDQNMTEAPLVPALTPAATTKTTATATKQITRTTRRKPQAPPPIPTLASTRSRRSSIAPISSVAGTPKSLSLPKRANKTSSVAIDGSATRSVTPRRALSGMDPNSLLSPSPSKSNSTMLSPDESKLSRRSSRHSISSSRSAKTTEDDTIVVAQPDSFRKQELDSFVVSEGGSMSLPDIQSLSFPPSLDSSVDDFGDLPEQDEDMSEEEALANVSKVDSVWEPQAEYRDTVQLNHDFTYVSTGSSCTPRVRKNRPSPAKGSPLFHDNPVGVETFYGSNDGTDDDNADEIEDIDMESSAMLPEEFSEPAKADFTYMPNGVSYTPRTKQKNDLFFSDPGSPLFKDNPVGIETFYGIPSSPSKSRDKGKGKAVEGSRGEITPEESPGPVNPSGCGVPKDQSFYPSSPPFEVVIPSPRKTIATPSLGKRSHDADVPDAPASRRRTDRETPSLIRVREASEIMSDALDVDEVMTMAEQHFGDGFEGPPTPESKEQSPAWPATDAEMENLSGSYSNLPKILVQSEEVSYPSLNITGIPSPPLSQHPELLSPPAKTPEAAPVLPVPAPSSGTANYFARIFSPLRRGGSSKATTPGTKTQTPVPMSWAPSEPAKTPDTDRLVHFADNPSKTGETHGDQTAILEAEWAREREENIRRAQEVGAITISDVTIPSPVGDRTKALQEEWERERSLVRRQAKEVGVISIDDTQEEEEEEEESFEGDEVLNQDTAAFEESLARHIESEERGISGLSPFMTVAKNETMTTTATKSRINTKVFTTRSIASSRSSPPPSAASTFATTTAGYATTRERAHIYTTNTTTTASASEADDEAAGNNMLLDSLLDTLTQPTIANSSGLTWTKENYRHLAAIVSSRSTDPQATNKWYSVQLDRPERLLAREVVEALELDKDMYLQLTSKECAAVERFCRREAVKGREWDVIEVVRRTAGLRVATLRRERQHKRR